MPRTPPQLVAYAPWTPDRAQRLFDRRIELGLDRDKVLARAKVSRRSLEVLESEGSKYVRASDLASVCKVLKLHPITLRSL